MKIYRFSDSKFVYWSDQYLALRGEIHPVGLIQIFKVTNMKTIKNRNKNGRPPKAPAEKKGYKVTLKMATEEYFSLKAKALTAKISRSEYIRQCIRSSVVQQRLTSELMEYIRQLCGMANNVNQIAHKANVAGYQEASADNLAMNERLDNIIKLIEDGC